jgi:hypothetical protein
MVGAPVRMGELTLKLVKGEGENQAQHRRTGWYQVKAVQAADSPL